MAAQVLAVDIGGTKLAAGLVDDDGAVLVSDRTPTTPGASGEDLWDSLVALTERVRRRGGSPQVVGVGIGSGGPMRWPSGEVSPLNIPGWRDFPLRARFQERYPGVPVRVHNDAVAVAIAEHWRGAGQGTDEHARHGRLDRRWRGTRPGRPGRRRDERQRRPYRTRGGRPGVATMRVRWHGLPGGGRSRPGVWPNGRSCRAGGRTARSRNGPAASSARMLATATSWRSRRSPAPVARSGSRSRQPRRSVTSSSWRSAEASPRSATCCSVHCRHRSIATPAWSSPSDFAWFPPRWARDAGLVGAAALIHQGHRYWSAD